LLKDYLSKHLDKLSGDSKRRFETNPLRIFDSKERNDAEVTQNAPKLLDHLEPESRNRFDAVLNGLTKLGVAHEYDFRLVRGFDYYTDTTFEFVSDKLGAQDAIGGGGRYDGLVELLGGKPTPGAGFGSGIERVLMAAEGNDFEFPPLEKVTIYFVTSGDAAKELAMKLSLELRKNNIGCETDLLGRSLKSQMREANKLGSKYVVIIGDDEIKREVLLLKNMSDGSQSEISADNAPGHLIKLK
jgi:histidyl-tRNA synthetase